MIILVCCVHNFILQNYIASLVLLVYKLQRYVPKLRILLLIHERGNAFRRNRGSRAKVGK